MEWNQQEAWNLTEYLLEQKVVAWKYFKKTKTQTPPKWNNQTENKDPNKTKHTLKDTPRLWPKLFTQITFLAYMWGKSCFSSLYEKCSLIHWNCCLSRQYSVAILSYQYYHWKSQRSTTLKQRHSYVLHNVLF